MICPECGHAEELEAFIQTVLKGDAVTVDDEYKCPSCGTIFGG